MAFVTINNRCNRFIWIATIGFKYAAQISEGVLRLQEMGKLAELQKKWWKERKGGGACSVRSRDPFYFTF